MLAVLATRVALQFDSPFGPTGVDVDVTTGLGSGALGAFFTTLVVGAILVTFAPDWTRTMTARVVDDTVGSFVYGVVSLLFFVLAGVVLFVTLVGIPLAILLAIVVGLVWAVGAAVAYLAIAERLLGADESDMVLLVAAAAMNGVLTLTGIGGLVSFLVGATGFGALLRDRL
ncbi:hypothetical protein G9C85_15740 [Halorubellus sp. JP-L1]|nr:hypothetical protein [Halorubellus sp. JP-L1]